MRRGNLRGSSDKSILDPTPNRSSSGFKLLAPLVIATIIICVIYLLNTESHTAVTADNSTYHGKTKNPLVIVGDEFFNLPTGDKQLHYITGGQGDPLFILIHDQSRRYQSAKHWAAHYDLFDTLGTFIALDLLGYGKSVPGANDDLRASEIQQADYVNRLIDARFSEYKEIVIVARGWGVTVAIELGKRVENRLKGFVFIAPEVAEVYTQAIPPAVSSKPMLLTWAKDDPKAEFSEHTRWLGLFSNVQTYFIEQVVQTGMHVVVANIPENIRVFEFQNAVHDFVDRLGLVRPAAPTENR